MECVTLESMDVGYELVCAVAVEVGNISRHSVVGVSAEGTGQGGRGDLVCSCCGWGFGGDVVPGGSLVSFGNVEVVGMGGGMSMDEDVGGSLVVCEFDVVIDEWGN